MEKEVELHLEDEGHGYFYMEEHREEIGRMDIKISGQTLTAIHTEVKPAYEGKGFAKKIFLAMVTYARENHLKVRALCPYVMLQFKKNPGEYADVIL